MAADRMTLTIDFDERPATKAVKAFGAGLDTLEAQALRMAQSVGSAFQKMTTDIQSYVSTLKASIASIPAYATPASSSGFGAPQRRRANQIIDMVPDPVRPALGAGGGRGALVPFGGSPDFASYSRQVQTASEETKKLGDSTVVSMLKAAAFYEAIRHGISIVKEATLGAAQYAARTEQLKVGLSAVAAANGITNESIEAQVKSVQKLGVTTQDTYQVLSRMIGSQLDFKKATDLARAAQDLGRITGEGTAQTLQRLTQAIVGGEIEMVRNMGVSVNYEKAYKTLGKTLGVNADNLTEVEKRQARLNEVLKGAALYAGVYEASLGTVGGSMLSLKRVTDEAKNAFGDQFQGALGTVTNLMTGVLKSVQNNATAISILVKIVATAAITWGAYRLAVAAATTATTLATAATVGLRGAMAALAGMSPAGWIGIAVGALAGLATAFTLAKTKTDLVAESNREHLKSLQEQRRGIIEGRVEVDNATEALKKLDEQMGKVRDGNNRTVLRDRLSELAQREKDLAAGGGQFVGTGLGGVVRVDTSSERLEIARQRTAIERELAVYDKADRDRLKKPPTEARDAVVKAGLTNELTTLRQQLNDAKTVSAELLAQINRESSAVVKILSDLATEAAKLKDKGLFTAETNNLLQRIANEKLLSLTLKEQVENRKQLLEVERRGAEERARALDVRSDRFGESQSISADSIRQDFESLQQTLSTLEQRSIEATRDARFRQLELTEAQYFKLSVGSKVQIEQERLKIETDFLQKSAIAHSEQIRRRVEADVQMLQAERDALDRTKDPGRYEALNQQIAVIQQIAGRQAQVVEQEWINATKAAQERSSVVQGQIVRDHWASTYDSIKRQSEGIFDALLTRTTSVWQTIANTFKNAMLTAIKDIVSSQVARSLTGLFAGMGGSNQQVGSTGGGILGALRGVLGGGMALPGADGRTPGFAGGQMGGVQQVPGMIGVAMASNGQLAIPSKGGFLSSLFGNGSGIIGTKSAQSTFGQSGMFGKAGGAMQGALLAGGAMLALDGWQRGGWAGAAELTGGGAAIGGAVAGPMGAAIGAGVGFTVGALKAIFGKTATQQMKEAVQRFSGVRIEDKAALKAMVDAWKASGTAVDAFVRSRAGQDMIESYAAQTGQKFKNAYNVGQFNMLLSNGSVYENPSYLNGVANPVSSLPSLDGVSGRSASSQTVINISVPGAKQFFEEETVRVVVDNPRAVSRANTAGLLQNVGRFAQSSLSTPTGISS